MRREGRPSDQAILSARIIDRTIRPLFNQQIRTDVQVVVSVLAMGDADPDVMGVIGSSLALAVSDIPWRGPVGAVRIGRDRTTQEILINPNQEQRAEAELDLDVLACGKDSTINMIETAALEVDEADIASALKSAVKIHTQLEDWQKQIVSALGKEKISDTSWHVPETLHKLFVDSFADKLSQTLFSNTAGTAHITTLKKEFLIAGTSAGVPEEIANYYFQQQVDEQLHKGAIEDGLRADGRAMDQVRELYAQAGGVSEVLHGSGIFYRGGTHIFSALTLGGPDSAQLIDSIALPEHKKHFLHHYNFPPYSVGETGRVSGFNRRMIGHGALAEKALLPVIPTQSEFPYTIRLVSETLASNGSSSMGSVCASTLALMDGGVPIKRPVAGIASGVMIQDDKYVLLTDIQGPEDEFGDMDFKVAGTTHGVTAIQMDVKVSGIKITILTEALEKARVARLHILDTMTQAIPTARKTISPRAPQIIVLHILPEQIGLVIGSGGKTINLIKEQAGVEDITIEDDGAVFITGSNDTVQTAANQITQLTKVYEVGEKLDVTILNITAFGAFAKLDAYNQGLIHISEVAPFHLESLDGILAAGDTVSVVVSKVENGKIGLSIKQINPDFTNGKIEP
jgi:polyribonucleotide nucleotidyltransferase